MRYSFLNSPALSLGDMLPRMFAGIRRMVAIHQNGGAGTEAYLWDEGRNAQRLDSQELDMGKNLPPGNKPYLWAKPSGLPFSLKGKHDESIQIKGEEGLFEELRHTVLCLQLGLKEEGRLFFYLYFNQNHGNFGLSGADEKLGTWHKEMTARQLVGILDGLAEQRQADREIWQVMDGFLKGQGGQAGPDKETERMKDFLRRQIKELARLFLSGFSGSGVVFDMSSEAAEKLSMMEAAPGHLQGILQKACIIAANSAPGQSICIIRPEHIIEEPAGEKGKDKPAPRRQDRALAYLDKLEAAAQKVESEGEKLTGARVGANMPQAISAPAITDALKNNSRTIVRLLDKYPGRWPLIREKFKPLGNILSSEGDKARGRTAS
jgi:hypothetical protein